MLFHYGNHNNYKNKPRKMWTTREKGMYAKKGKGEGAEPKRENGKRGKRENGSRPPLQLLAVVRRTPPSSVATIEDC